MTVAMHWNDREKILEIKDAQGCYPGAPGSRIMKIDCSGKQRTVSYEGRSLKVKF